MKHLPIAKTELKKIVEGNFCYVDKTMFVKELLDDGHGYYFLSRPRRFGKSLFLDTLRAAFAGEKELFKGLYIEDKWDWNIKHPIISISFGKYGVTNVAELNIVLINLLDKLAIEFELQLSGNFVYERFLSLLENVYKKIKIEVVVLIDEYDKPILDNLTKPESQGLRDTLGNFYSVFSFVPKYADICGYTQIDLETNFIDYLHGVDLEKVKKWYDGYNFLGSQLYNPYDV